MLKASLLDSKAQIEMLVGGASFGKRCALARCIGLVSQSEVDDIHRVAAVRNRFAHGCPMPTFDDPEIASRIGKLSIYKEARAWLDRRAIFVKTAYILSRRLNEKLAKVKQIKRGAL